MLAPEALSRKLRNLFSGRGLSIEIVSGRASHALPRLAGEALTSELAPKGIAASVHHLADARTPSSADIVLLLCHINRDEPKYLTALRNSGFTGIVVGWFWDNHHAKERNREVADLVDVAIAAHDPYARYLAKHAVLFPSVMLCATQWSADEARGFWAADSGESDRSPELYGGFGRYGGSERTAYLERLIATGKYPALHFVNGDGRHAYFDYFSLSSEAKFRHWMGYAVSLCLPYRNDLGLRFFDAWLTGQIPVVTPDIKELAAAWAEPHRDRDFVCAASYEEADIDAAHARALELFETGGAPAREARHRLALERHLLQHRVERIVEMLRQAAQ